MNLGVNARKGRFGGKQQALDNWEQFWGLPYWHEREISSIRVTFQHPPRLKTEVIPKRAFLYTHTREERPETQPNPRATWETPSQPRNLINQPPPPKKSRQREEDGSHHPTQIISRVALAALISLLDISYFISRSRTPPPHRLGSRVHKL